VRLIAGRGILFDVGLHAVVPLWRLLMLLCRSDLVWLIQLGDPDGRCAETEIPTNPQQGQTDGEWEDVDDLRSIILRCQVRDRRQEEGATRHPAGPLRSVPADEGSADEAR